MTSSDSQPRPGDVVRRVAVYGMLVIIVALFLIPVYLVLITSFKMPSEVDTLQPWKLPMGINLSGFASAISTLGPYFVNSLMLTIPATTISAILGSLNGYVLSKWRFRGANIIFPLMLFGM